MRLAGVPLEVLHRVEDAASVGGEAHQVGGLAEGRELGEGDDDDKFVPGPGDDDVLAVVDDRVQDLGVARNATRCSSLTSREPPRPYWKTVCPGLHEATLERGVSCRLRF